jgi:hypothetical protein
VLVAVKLALGARPTYPQLADALQMSLSEVHGAVKRATAAGLVGPDRRANRVALLDFLLQGVKHAFVPKRGPLTRGMPTAHGAPPLDQLVGIGAEPPPVWPDPEGTMRGESFAPLYRSVPKAAKKDPKLYEALCLIDAIRGGRPRDYPIAEQHLRRLLFPSNDEPGAQSGGRSIHRTFSIAAPNRQRIVRGLAKIGPGPESFYRSALDILSLDPPLAATSHLVSHLAREIESALRKLLFEMTEVRAEEPIRHSDKQKKRNRSSRDADSHREMIRSVLPVLGISIDGPLAQFWLGLAGKENPLALARRAHRDELNAPRVMDADFLRFWEQFEEILEKVLDGLDEKYVIVLDRLDRLLATSSPTEADAEILRGKIPQSQVALEYFFGKLDNPAWIEPLAKVGFFGRPPSPVSEAGGVLYPSWHALKYVARMASRAPEAVSCVALTVPETTNFRVHETLAEIALGLPSHLAAPFADRVEHWLPVESSFSLDYGLVENLVDLVERLVTAHEGDAAIRVMRALLRPVPAPEGEHGRHVIHEPQARLTDLDLRRITDRLLPSIKSLGHSGLEMLSALLEEALALNRENFGAGWDDHSWIWRPAIEDHARNDDYGLLTHLVSATRDAAECFVEADPMRLSEIVTSFEARHWVVFRRLALHILERFASQERALAAARLLERSSFDSPELEHEYIRLLRTSFADLEPKQQETFLSWVRGGPAEVVGEGWSVYVERWKLRWLTAIGDGLPDSWRAEFEALKATLGEQATLQDLRSPISFAGPTSPYRTEDLIRMTPEQVVDVADSWQPSPEFGTPAPEGLSRSIAAVVEKAADVYAARAKVLERLDPTYLRGVFGGFRSAIQAGRSFDWSPVLDLCVWATSRPRKIPGRTPKIMGFDAHWGHARRAVLELLSQGMTTNNLPIPIELRARVWSAIEPALDDPDGKTDLPQSDPVHASLNCVRGSALYAAIDYARWLARGASLKGLPSEVRDALEAKLAERSDATRAVYGNRIGILANLDEEWCRAHVRAMFARDRDDKGRDPAWKTYLLRGHLSLNVFRLLRWRYEMAVAEWKDHTDLDSREQELARRVGSHLAQLYWHGKINLGERNDLVDKFFAHVPPSIASDVIDRLGCWLHEETPLNADLLRRLKVLWAKRAADAHKPELAAFGRWFSSGRFDDEWALEELQKVLAAEVLPHAHDQVVTRLAALIPRHLPRVLECLELLVRVDDRGWGVLNWRIPTAAILTAALASDGSHLRVTAETVISRLCAKGYLDFRALLEVRTDASLPVAS